MCRTWSWWYWYWTCYTQKHGKRKIHSLIIFKSFFDFDQKTNSVKLDTYCELGLKFVNWLNVLRFVAELVAIVVVKLFPICMMNRSMNPHSNQCQKYRIHRFVLPCLIVILCKRPLDAIEFQINNDIVKSIGYEKLGEKKWNWKRTVLFAASVDLTGTSASSETVRRMHDDSVALSNKCVLPVNQSIFFQLSE